PGAPVLEGPWCDVRSTVTMSRDLLLSSAAFIDTDAQTTFDIQGDWSIRPGSGQPVGFYNHGLFKKSGGSAASLLEVPFFNHGGTTRVESGLLRFQSGFEQQAASARLE